MPIITVRCPFCNQVLGAPGKQNLCNHCWTPLNQDQIRRIMETTIAKHNRQMGRE